jgi:hypothetical protein
MAQSFGVGGGDAAEKWVSFTLLRLSEIEKGKQREYRKVVIDSCGPVNGIVGALCGKKGIHREILKKETISRRVPR